MLTTVEVFDLIKQRHHIASDYALAKRLGVTAALICHHRAKPFGMKNELALKCAALAGIDEELLVLWASAERAKCTREKEIFQRMAALFQYRILANIQ